MKAYWWNGVLQVEPETTDEAKALLLFADSVLKMSPPRVDDSDLVDPDDFRDDEAIVVLRGGKKSGEVLGAGAGLDEPHRALEPAGA